MYHCTPGTVDCFPVLSYNCIFFRMHGFSYFLSITYKQAQTFFWFICPSITWRCYGTVQNNLFHTIISAIQNFHHAQFWHNSEMSKLHQTKVGGKRTKRKKKNGRKSTALPVGKGFHCNRIEKKQGWFHIFSTTDSFGTNKIKKQTQTMLITSDSS